MTNSFEPPSVAEPSPEDLERLGRVLRQIGGANVVWGAKDVLDLWVVEYRAQLDQRMSARIQVTSWALVVATIGLVVCTGGLIWATFAA